MKQIGVHFRKEGGLSRDYIAETIVLVDDPCCADLIYLNNPPYDHILNLRNSGKLRTDVKIIFNVLDLPLHLLPSGYNPMEHYFSLKSADAVTVISEYVRAQVQNYYNLSPYLIYNPIKDVNSDIRQSNKRIYPYNYFKAMIVGRAADPNKHNLDISIPALQMAGFTEDQVVVVGGENVGWGTTWGIVDDETLNQLYNHVDYVMISSWLEGLCLPCFEAMLCGAIPIITHSLSTAQEFNIPIAWQCYPSAHAVAYRLKQLEDNPELRQLERELAMGLGKCIEPKLNKMAVAERILNVYDQICS